VNAQAYKIKKKHFINILLAHMLSCACITTALKNFLIFIFVPIYRRLLVMQRDVTAKEGRVKGLGVFVQCNPDTAEMQ